MLAVPHRRAVRWRNWAGNQAATPAWLVGPRSEDEAVAAVRFAVAEGLGIRVVGAGHSFSPLVGIDGMLLDLARLTGVTGVDRSRRRVRVRAGTRIADLGAPLWDAGLALANQGDIDRQTVAGALATATHGSGIRLGSMSTALRWVCLVDGRGEVREIGEDDLDRLRAAQVSLGTLGVFLELELAVEERYLLAESFSYPGWPEVLARWPDDIAANRHYSFFWCQTDAAAGAYGLTAPAGIDFTDRCWVRRLNPATGEVAGARVDRAYRIYADEYAVPFHELEYYVPAADGPAAVGVVRELMLGRHAGQRFPMDVRWVAADEAYLSPFHRRDTTVVSVSGEPGTAYWPFLADVASALDDFGARAHWGKINFLTRDRVAARYPELDRFTAVRRELDPAGVFLNDHTRELLG